MAQLITGGVWITKALYVVAELAIADRLAEGPRTAEALAEAAGAHAPSLYRVLRALASIGVFAEDEYGRFSLTPLADTLRSDQVGSLRGMAQLWGHPGHWEAWGSFLDTVRTGRSAFELAFGVPLFAFFAQRPDVAQLFNQAMTAFSGYEADAVAAAYDFAGTVIDVGGGQGQLLATILQRFPGTRGVLFDQPAVVTAGTAPLAALGVRERATVVGGDFFTAAPAGGDIYILKNIVHDFDDQQARVILSVVRRAMGTHGRLLVAQEVIPTGNAPSGGKLLDMQMLLIGGRERTEGEYRDLLAEAGFRLARIIPLQAPLHLLEAVPA
jgi:hypothetical protein